MSCYEALGVAEGASESEIRRAYARRLKQSRPEDDAHAFAQLRQAYEEALARTRMQHPEPVDDADAERALAEQDAQQSGHEMTRDMVVEPANAEVVTRGGG
jgi:DnaJ-class molecular chaperone